LANLGSEYANTKQYDLAGEYLQKALHIKTLLSLDDDKASVLLLLAESFFKQAKNSSPVYFSEAEAAALEAYQIAAGIGAKSCMKQACEVLKNVYKEQHQPEKALAYFEQYKLLNDSLFSESKTEALASAEARWNVERKQQEIDNLENTRKLNEEIIVRKEDEARQQKVIIWAGAAVFLLSAVSITSGTLYLRKKREALYQKQLANMTALRMQNARNAMSPHFFFNVLSSLSGLSGQPERLKEKITSLSLLLRKVVQNIDRTAIPLKEELAAVKAYIDLCREHVPSPFKVEYRIDENADLEKLVPAMLLQIPVENAIKHGLMPLEGERNLWIGIDQDTKFQRILIKDNGIGLKASAGKSVGTGTGLKVLLQTIHLLNTNNQSKIKFSMNELPFNPDNDSGTAVDIKVPTDFNFSL
jgi:LytS/YehU family sensor histidine kinase